MKIHIKHQTEIKNTLKNRRVYLDKLDEDNDDDLKEAFSYLSDEEKMLVENRYFKDLTQSEVAKIMDVNQVYVSRMEKKVLKKMKSKMTS